MMELNILVVGQTGQMGRVLEQTIQKSPHHLVAGIGHPKDITKEDVNIYSDFNDIPQPQDIDVIIDFSTPHLLEPLLNFATKHKIPVVIATTGIENTKLIEKASQAIPIVYAGNYSLGVNVLEKVAEVVAKALKDFDIEITETHHNLKVDAPSGTAHMLFDAVNRGRDHTLTQHQGRHGLDAKRTKQEVGMHALRGGTVVGTHTVSFFGTDEVIELTHTAYSKQIFAQGSLKAAEFIVHQQPGLYDVNDVLEGE